MSPRLRFYMAVILWTLFGWAYVATLSAVIWVAL
jgi:hypothetical protein